jgi:Fe-S-cluster containining protein
MAAEAHSTATLRLSVGDLRIAHPITVPTGPVAAADVVPALQGLVNAVVAAAEAGKAISCRKGCGACCRQLVPVSRTEAERLMVTVATLPAERRATLEARFSAAEAALAAANLKERKGRPDRELSTAYFALGIACPFLEDESCSIHPDRPLVCREYLVTSPAALCAGPEQEGVTPVPVPKVSLAARGLQDEGEEWFPLALLMDWAKTRPKGGARRTGPEWIQKFLKGMSRKT